MDGFVGLMTFCLLTAASLGGVFLPRRYLIEHHSDETAAVFRSVVSLFIMMTSLVLGLMLNSARGTFEATDRDIHLLSADLILMDRALLQYGDDTADTRARLRSYTERAATGLHQTDPRSADRTSEYLLTAIGTSLARVQPTNSQHANLLRDITAQYQAIVQLRWTILEQADGSIPKPLLTLVVAWLAFVFASFGYRAPLNGLVVSTLVVSAALMASAIYLLLTLDQPFNGLIQVSSTPLERALAEMER